MYVLRFKRYDRLVYGILEPRFQYWNDDIGWTADQKKAQRFATKEQAQAQTFKYVVKTILSCPGVQIVRLRPKKNLLQGPPGPTGPCGPPGPTGPMGPPGKTVTKLVRAPETLYVVVNAAGAAAGRPCESLASAQEWQAKCLRYNCNGGYEIFRYSLSDQVTK